MLCAKIRQSDGSLSLLSPDGVSEHARPKPARISVSFDSVQARAQAPGAFLHIVIGITDGEKH